jgi:hypothetical protein
VTRYRRAPLVGALAATLLLASCAATPGADPITPSGPVAEPPAVIAAAGPVTGQGTVIQTGDAAPQLCLGPVALSYPPQCSGIEIAGWDWGTVDGDETAGDVTFGTYAVTGTWDGSLLTATSSIMLALYDPMVMADPLVDPANAGDSTDAELTHVHDQLTADAPFEILAMTPQNGYLFVQVVYDDGSIQAWADATFLPDVVAVRSSLVG